LLLVVLDEQVVVAAGALQVHAQEQPPHVADQAILIDRILTVILETLGQEEGRALRGRRALVAAEDLLHQHVPRLVRPKRLLEVFIPGWADPQPFHEHHVE